MFYLLNWKFWVLTAALVLYPIAYMKGRQDGARMEKLGRAAAVAAANNSARALEQHRVDLAAKAARNAAAAQARIVADAARARRERDGMRDDLRAVQQYAAQSADAARQSVAALTDVFDHCSRSYTELAEIADRHSADSLMLQQAWPR